MVKIWPVDICGYIYIYIYIGGKIYCNYCVLHFVAALFLVRYYEKTIELTEHHFSEIFVRLQGYRTKISIAIGIFVQFTEEICIANIVLAEDSDMKMAILCEFCKLKVFHV